MSPEGSCCAAVVAQNTKVEGKWKDLKQCVVYKMLRVVFFDSTEQ